MRQLIQLAAPELSPRDTPIAEAAAKAGFDCSDWTKLQRLVEAVRAVDAPVSYPDRWTGPAAINTPLYPERSWAANPIKPRRGVVRSHQEADRHVSVPTFVVPASQIIRNMNSLPRINETPQTSTMRRNSHQLIPDALAPRHGTKWRSDDLIDLGSSSTKRARTEAPITSTTTGSSQAN
ncbi:hypothetical protein N7G274_004960 [Stereocaulon virgatum]|uniref:Uncharacterized protein n=1 Tax=Stereocaulon virgatum TaxID=373712 RepID=A0ABR4AD60_9LECA